MRHLLLFAALVAFLPSTIFAQTTKPPTTASPAPKATVAQKIVTGSVLLNERTAPDFKALLATLKTDWKFRIDSVTINAKTLVFTTAGTTVTLAYLDYALAPNEIKAAANLSWLWRTAAQEAGRHQAQVVISVIGSPARALDLYKTFTRIAGGTLENTRSIGIYMNNQYLLLAKGFYTAAAHNMLTNNSLPVYCWVHFGTAEADGKSSGYTFGLKEFGLSEMEIVQSARPASEVHAVLYDAAATVIEYNTKVRDGQPLTTREDQQLSVKLSPSAVLEGQTTAKLGF
ncbi:MAG: DUF4261 domain-containing protein [Saprospiraceae bacterium]|nr:DUF4261 domain-containing protein [Saprospiraceae bacterium]